MGLDFSLYKKRKYISPEDFYNYSNNCTDDIELAYGRKSWELVEALCNGTDNQVITKERWDALMKDIEPIANKLDDISEAFEHYYDQRDNSELIFTNLDEHLVAEYEKWYDETFGCVPYLGYDFSVGYIKNFWDANKKVQEVFKDPEYEVFAEVSY